MVDLIGPVLSGYQGLISNSGVAGIAAAVFFENLGIPLPIAPAYIFSQYLIDKGEYSREFLLFVLYIGHMAGALLSYYAGRRIASEMKAKEGFTDTQHKIALWYEKYGAVAVFGTRLIGYVRPWSSYVAGIAEVKFWQFFIFSSLGTLILNFITLYFTNQFVKVWQDYAIARAAISVSFAAGFVVIIWQLYKKRMSKRAQS